MDPQMGQGRRNNVQNKDRLFLLRDDTGSIFLWRLLWDRLPSRPMHGQTPYSHPEKSVEAAIVPQGKDRKDFGVRSLRMQSEAWRRHHLCLSRLSLSPGRSCFVERKPSVRSRSAKNLWD